MLLWTSPRIPERNGMPANRDWGPIINQARIIVNSYAYQITLRQLHYRLVMAGGLPYRNTEGDYKALSSKTAELRRQRTFPALQDQTREIHTVSAWEGPGAAMRDLIAQYRRDRTKGQEYFIALAGEKSTLLAQLDDWFNNDADRDLGLPFILTRGYGSQTYMDQVKRFVQRDNRKAVLIYAGDFDPSGEDILRDFLNRCNVWDEVQHIAVRPEQVDQMSLEVAPGKTTDSRAAAFEERHGELVQVEVEAIEPNDLKQLYTDALEQYWDQGAYDAVIEREVGDKARLQGIANELDEEEDDDD